MKHINFKADDELINQLDTFAYANNLQRSELYRKCLEIGFESLEKNFLTKNKKLIFIYIDQKKYMKILKITKKHKLSIEHTCNEIFNTGFDVLEKLDFIGFMKLAKGVYAFEDLIKKIIKKKQIF